MCSGRSTYTRRCHVLAHANLTYFAISVGITLGAMLPMAWRWQRLLAARGVDAPLSWLARTYYVSFAVGQVLPTSLGGDAARIYSTGRRYPGSSSVAAGSVILERALGGAATLTLAAVGFVLAIGRYDVGPYLWLEGALTLGTVVAAVLIFSRRFRGPLGAVAPLLGRLRIERPLRAVYQGLHGYRDHARLLGFAFVLTIAVQAVRVVGIWLVGKACGVDLSPRPYFVLGPLSLPRHARTLHGERHRDSRGVLRQLPRQAARRSGSSLRDRLPLLSARARCIDSRSTGAGLRGRHRASKDNARTIRTRQRMVEGKSVAVVIPAYNEERLLGDTLRGIPPLR